MGELSWESLLKFYGPLGLIVFALGMLRVIGRTQEAIVAALALGYLVFGRNGSSEQTEQETS